MTARKDFTPNKVSPLATEPMRARVANVRQATARARGQHARRDILRRAADLASLDGLDRVSIGRLASAMDMSKSGLYAYFASKQDLQLATIDCAWRVFHERVLENAEGPGELPDLLERWIAYYEREEFPGGCFFVTAAVEFANRGGAVHDALAQAIERQIAALHAAAVRAREAGGLSGAADAAQVAFELHAFVTSANERYRLTGDPEAFAQARVAVRRVLARG
ncbi:MAG: TetR/AcrR family transcriptional regulator [Actinomycetota bacterium]|nr:TetR/AcrR family transcriptional regulator [Actinomycetota bacterium]